MNKKIDFLIRYEHKVRELESIILLKLELERRGYSVALKCNYDYKTEDNYKPSVLVVPAAYYPEHIMPDLIRYGYNKKIVNLQWEQIFQNKNERNLSSPYNIHGCCRNIKHLLWGEQECNRLIYGGLIKENALKVGQLNTDLLRDSFKQTLIPKKKLASKYNLNNNSKWYLFISSFAYCELDKLQEKMCINMEGKENFEYFKQLSDKSRAEILLWFEQVLVCYPETIIIYRPHPDEAKKSTILKELEAKYSNFRVISELALKHWINACDKIYNWYSTGQVDVNILAKPYRFLRPECIKQDIDYKLFLGIESIKNEQNFIYDFNNVDNKIIIKKEVFDSYYYIPENYVYQNICDILEDMLNTNNYDAKFKISDYFKVYFYHILFCIKRGLFLLLSNSFKQQLKLLFGKHIPQSIIDGYDKNVASVYEIEQIEHRLKPIVYGQ